MFQKGSTLFREQRLLSTTASATTNATEPTSNAKTKTKHADKPNIFLDNLGTIFLSVIGLIIASLVRSYYGTANRNRLRDAIEEQAALDPVEIDDLRVANSELQVDVFRTIMQQVQHAFPTPTPLLSPSPSPQEITYEEFSQQVRRTMIGLKGEAFTIELGHLIDRVVIAALQRHNKTTQDRMPLAFWFTVLSLALHSPVPERIQILYQVLQDQAAVTAESTINQVDGDSTSTTDSSSSNNNKVSIRDVRQMVGYLQDTCQLVPDTQIVPTEEKYPTQQYERGSPEQLVQWEQKQLADEEVDIDAFASILRSRSVCAWGECYHRKKVV